MRLSQNVLTLYLQCFIYKKPPHTHTHTQAQHISCKQTLDSFVKKTWTGTKTLNVLKQGKQTLSTEHVRQGTLMVAMFEQVLWYHHCLPHVNCNHMLVSANTVTLTINTIMMEPNNCTGQECYISVLFVLWFDLTDYIIVFWWQCMWSVQFHLISIVLSFCFDSLFCFVGLFFVWSLAALRHTVYYSFLVVNSLAQLCLYCCTLLLQYPLKKKMDLRWLFLTNNFTRILWTFQEILKTCI